MFLFCRRCCCEEEEGEEGEMVVAIGLLGALVMVWVRVRSWRFDIRVLLGRRSGVC